jgi:hypothetical protein
MDDADPDVADDDLVPVGEGLVRVVGRRGRVDRDGQALLEREPPVTRDVVGVRVRLEHADEPRSQPLRLFQVGLDPVGGIDEDGRPGRLAPDEVRGAAEIVVQELLEEHRP